MKTTKSRPILPNSSPDVLRERRNRQGTYRVAWIEQIDAHGLFFTDDRGITILLATHNNGHSCACLADRICGGSVAESEAQRVYIADCGGTVCRPKDIAYAATGIHPC